MSTEGVSQRKRKADDLQAPHPAEEYGADCSPVEVPPKKRAVDSPATQPAAKDLRVVILLQDGPSDDKYLPVEAIGVEAELTIAGITVKFRFPLFDATPRGGSPRIYKQSPANDSDDADSLPFFFECGAQDCLFELDFSVTVMKDHIILYPMLTTMLDAKIGIAYVTDSFDGAHDEVRWLDCKDSKIRVTKAELVALGL